MDERDERVEYTVDEAAEALGLSPQTVRDQIRRGRITSRVVGKRVNVIAREEVARYRLENLGRVGRPKGKGRDNDGKAGSV